MGPLLFSVNHEQAAVWLADFLHNKGKATNPTSFLRLPRCGSGLWELVWTW